MKPQPFARMCRTLMAGTAVAALLPLMAMAQGVGGGIDGCTLTQGVMAPGCRHANAGTLVTMPATGDADPAPADLGAEGFSISIEAADPAAPPARIAGTGDLPAQTIRQVDRLLAEAGVQVTYDGLGQPTRLAIATEDLRSSYVAGAQVSFRASSNYPAWIDRAEVRVIDRDHPGRVLATLPVAPNGRVAWTIPVASADGSGDEMLYTLRVYDAAGRYDETRAVPLSRSAKDFGATAKDGPVFAAGEGDDMTARRSIPVQGGAVTVTGDNLGPGSRVQVLGEEAVADGAGVFVIQRILPPGVHDVRVGIGQGSSINRRVEVPRQEWFYTGLADLTLGRANSDSYTLGRLAAYAKGTTASGYRLTASIDTREDELRYIFRNLDEKDPDRILRRINPDDVYSTFGDDSTSFNDAQTSGKFYLKVEKDRSFLLWGDFKAENGASRLIRSDRTLYGAQLVHRSTAVTARGEARLAFSGYAAEPNRLVGRDVLRGTGGSTFFLQRQDIIGGTATIMVQYRDPVSGTVVRTQDLVEGSDYEIDYLQGVVILRRPLSSATGTGVIIDRPLGDLDVDLVAQYEYIPTTTSVEGISAGGRVEGWVTDALRLGVSAQSETTGLADNRIYGGDILLRRSEDTYLSFEAARSEGPGFGTNGSLNGGLDVTPNPTAGINGVPAYAYRLEGKADLEELTGGALAGQIGGYFDRKERGFVSTDYDIDQTQRSWGVNGSVKPGARSELAFSVERFRDDAGKRQNDAQAGLSYALGPRLTAQVALGYTERRNPLAPTTESGERTDLGARLTWKLHEDLSLWAFGQATLARTGSLYENNRGGAGASLRLNDRLRLEGEASDGSLGFAGLANLSYDTGNGSQYRIGYKLDPLRAADNATFTGSDSGTWVIGAERRVSDTINYRTETSYDLFGDQRSQASAYGVNYTPSDRWAHTGNVELGEARQANGDTLKRRGFSLGTTYSDGDYLKAGLKGEYRTETSTDAAQNRDTWLISSYVRYKTSEDWRLIANIDALISSSDQSSFRDGRYIEANFGFAYRPAENDRLNALMRYTFLEDLPGADQVNVDGDLAGARQRSHIVSIDANYDLTKELTIGGKYGYRLGQVAERGTSTFVRNTGDLAILRLDYHIVHNWDLMVEGRTLGYRQSDTREHAALVGAWRHFGNNFKVGAGYQWGDVSDDLRSLAGNSEGVFLNIVGKF